MRFRRESISKHPIRFAAAAFVSAAAVSAFVASKAVREILNQCLATALVVALIALAVHGIRCLNRMSEQLGGDEPWRESLKPDQDQD